MKIAMIGHKRIPTREGGIEIVVAELSKRMTALGNEVTAYNRKSRHIAGREFDAKRQKNYEGVHIKWIYTPESAKLNALVYSFLATVAAIFGGFDVLHYHAEGPCAMLPLAHFFGKRCVATIHGLDWQRAKWGGFATKFLLFGERCAAKYADEIIVLSENVQQYFLDTYGRKTVFIPNGIDKPVKRPACVIEENYGLQPNHYLLFLGRLVPEKCVHLLIEAYRGIETDLPLVIAGGASHTSAYETEVKQLAAGDSRIIFTGFVQGIELEELYSNAYVYILPSDLEGMPISLLEAMSFGNCCLTSDIPECTEVCGDKALHFAKGDAGDLRRQLTYLLSHPEAVKAYQSTAQAYICEKYNWNDVTRQTLALYEKSTN